MGYRTVVMLDNDWAREWEKDPELGRKISTGMMFAGRNVKTENPLGSYGSVVECVHADIKTMVVLGDYDSFETLSTKFSYGGVSVEMKLDMLRDVAEELGYRLIKKSTNIKFKKEI